MTVPIPALARLRRDLRLELRPMLQLAWPVVVAEVGWVMMSLVDTMMVGRVSAAALGAVSLGGILFFAIAIFGMGMLLGLDYAVAHAVGAGRVNDAHRALVHGAYLSLVLTVVLTPVLWGIIGVLPSWGIEPSVLAATLPYLRAITWSLLPLLLFSTLRRYLQARGLVKPIMTTLVSANLVNLAGCWVLVFGNLGAPALGAEGAGWATCVSRFYMFGSLLAYVVALERRDSTGLFRTRLRPELAYVRQLVRLGLPAALQTSLEVGVFAAATTLAGKLDAESLAAHQVALSAASFTFMIPLGVSSAAAVRVGHALGRGEEQAAARAGWAALSLGAGFMLTAAVAFVCFPRVILRGFTSEEAVIATGASLLAVAALFQLFDGLQVVATGALRGTGDTRTPMITNLLGHWLLGLPVGYVLCFWRGWGVVGLWCGLSTGLIAVALVLVYAWSRHTRNLRVTAEAS
jgi:MATE family multidrug resistance protein